MSMSLYLFVLQVGFADLEFVHDKQNLVSGAVRILSLFLV